MKNKFWTMTAKAGGELEILLYSVIGEDFWTGDGITAKKFAEDLKAAGAVSRIRLRANSPGGNVMDGLVHARPDLAFRHPLLGIVAAAAQGARGVRGLGHVAERPDADAALHVREQRRRSRARRIAGGGAGSGEPGGARGDRGVFRRSRWRCAPLRGGDLGGELKGGGRRLGRQPPADARCRATTGNSPCWRAPGPPRCSSTRSRLTRNQTQARLAGNEFIDIAAVLEQQSPVLIHAARDTLHGVPREQHPRRTVPQRIERAPFVPERRETTALEERQHTQKLRQQGRRERVARQGQRARRVESGEPCGTGQGTDFTSRVSREMKIQAHADDDVGRTAARPSSRPGHRRPFGPRTRHHSAI